MGETYIQQAVVCSPQGCFWDVGLVVYVFLDILVSLGLVFGLLIKK